MQKPNISYFVSYAHADELALKLHDALRVHLSISSARTFEPWCDTGILPGEDWHGEIQAALDGCDMGLLMVSPTYVSRGYIKRHELPKLRDSDKVLIPVHLHRVDFG
ncbi:MAG: toll/interleukin-1 receptor domain-containing protein, partial [Nannocystaceae bacterium]